MESRHGVRRLIPDLDIVARAPVEVRGMKFFHRAMAVRVGIRQRLRPGGTSFHRPILQGVPSGFHHLYAACIASPSTDFGSGIIISCSAPSLWASANNSENSSAVILPRFMESASRTFLPKIFRTS